MVEKKIIELLEHAFESVEFNLLNNIVADEKYPYQNYIGINFNSTDIISVKLYFSFFNYPSIDIVKQLIPDTITYEKFIKYYVTATERSLDNNGITFSLKIDINKFITKGYHFRFDKYIQGIPPINSFKAAMDDIMNVGICEEFGVTDKIIKYYYYFNKIHNKEKFSIRFNKPHLISSDLIEYTESDHFNKIIGCNVSSNSFYNKFLKYHSPIAMQLDSLFLNKFALQNNIAHGFYENSDIEAKYYFNLKKKSSIGNTFLQQDNLHINTIELLLKKIL